LTNVITLDKNSGLLFNQIKLSSKIYEQAKGNPNTVLNFQFSDDFFYDSFSFIYLALVLKNIQTEFGNSINFVNPEKASYGATIGFFKLAGFESGKDIGEAKGNENYIPITCLEIPDEDINIDEVHAEVVERMQALGEELSKRLLKVDEGEAFDALAYFCREILRNVIEHSYSDTLYYAAQAFANNKVLVVVADEGEGLLESLNENPKLLLASDEEAVKYALMAGVSGRAHKYEGSRSNNHIYKNSGYGLYLAKQICAMNGDFVLISNSAGVFAKEKGDYDIESTPFKGTILRLVIRLNEVGDINERLKKTIEQARLKMKESGQEFRQPSVASAKVKL